MSLILFPYSQISGHDLKNILALFGSLTIFRPWYMEQSFSLNDFSIKQNIKILYPSEKYKPRKEFKVLLSEYYGWIERNQDKSYRELLKQDQEFSSNEDATWEIRQLLRQMGQNSTFPEDHEIFDWHMILHLANEVEIQSMEADRLLKTLKDRKPLLDGSVETVDPSASPVIDLPGFTSESVLHKSHFNKIMEAWFGLFKENLGKHDVFITMDHQFMNHITEEWDTVTNKNKSIMDLTIRVGIPDLSGTGNLNEDETIPNSVVPSELEALRQFISKVDEDPIANFHSLEKWQKDSDSITPSDSQYKYIHVTIKHFPLLSNKAAFRGHEIIGQISGRTMLLMSEV